MLTISVVTYRPSPSMLTKTLSSLARSVHAAGPTLRTSLLTVIDNTELDGESVAMSQLLSGSVEGTVRWRLLAGHGNVGFGRGHNLALSTLGRYHLILNPDVEIAPDALARAIDFMESNPGCDLLSPYAKDARGNRQYLCKRYPTVFDLVLRGFASQSIRSIFRERLERYEMVDRIQEDVAWDPPIVSGCFMLFRSNKLLALSGFNPDYFLYFEDFDICMRTAKLGRIAYVPSVRIVHHGGGAARKGLRHVFMFARSALRFFSTYGWKWI